MELIVLGGRQRKAALERAEWHAYDLALIVRVNTESGLVTRCYAYVSPAETRISRLPSIAFRAGTIDGRHLYACTQTELMAFTLPDFRRTLYVSLPLFNDVHHVRPSSRGTLLVANTGLDMVVEIDSEGCELRHWSVVEGDPWKRFSRDIDYRKVPTTKPHLSHPNYVFEVDGRNWVTRFEQRDALCLDDPDLSIDIAAGRPHDGVVKDGSIFFTTVEGLVAEVDAASLRMRAVFDLNEIDGGDSPLGWCRGIHVEGRRVWVGFSRLRPTKSRQNVSWVKHGFRQKTYNVRPTRIACYDLERRTKTAEFDLEPYGINAVFDVLRDFDG